MEKLGRFFYVIFLLLLGGVSFADVKVEAKLSAEHVEVGDQFKLLIDVSSEENVDFPNENFNPPSPKGLEYMGLSSGSSTSMSIVNGKRSVKRSQTATLTYAAFKEGSYQIPRFSLGLGSGQKVGPFLVQVHKKLPGHLKSRRQKQGLGGLFDLDSFFGGKNPFGSSTQEPLEFFIESEIEKQQVYEGEQFLVKWHIYTNGSLASFDTLKFPLLRGFWKQDVDFVSRFRWEKVERKGKLYHRSLLSSHLLTPYGAGEFEIDAYKIRTQVVGRRFGFGNSPRKMFKVESQPVPIKVLPLPYPKPNSFYGGVGDFELNIEGANTKKEIRQGQGFDLVLRVKGLRSSSKFVKAPKLPLGEDFKVYSQTEEEVFDKNTLNSLKVFKYNLVPLKEGLYSFSDLKMSFFDSEEKVYKDQHVSLPTLKVLKSTGKFQVQDENFGKKQKEKKSSKTIFKPHFFDRWQGVQIPFLGGVLTLALGFMLGLGILYQTSKYQIPEEFLSQKLQSKKERALKSIQSRDFQGGLSELINVLYLLVGGVSGHRYGTQEEFYKSLDKLPSSLKSKKPELIALNKELQKFCFGIDLSLKENQVKLNACLERYHTLYVAVESYLS